MRERTTAYALYEIGPQMDPLQMLATRHSASATGISSPNNWRLYGTKHMYPRRYV